MIHSRKFVAAAILLGLALVIAGLLVAPFNGSARAAAGQPDPAAADRIGAAFSSLAEIAPDTALSAAAARVSKGDLEISPKCLAAVWPDIDTSCLSRTDGSPAQRVRTITIGYQAGENTTVLVRVPTAAMARR
jgi:hypothetical protein